MDEKDNKQRIRRSSRGRVPNTRLGFDPMEAEKFCLCLLNPIFFSKKPQKKQ